MQYIIPSNDGTYSFYCPGCKHSHGINDKWKIDLDTNTIHPSVLVHENWTMPDDWDFKTAPKNEDGSLKKNSDGRIVGAIKSPRCHSFVRNGAIQYLGDCTHELKGQTVPMEEE